MRLTLIFILECNSIIPFTVIAYCFAIVILLNARAHTHTHEYVVYIVHFTDVVAECYHSAGIGNLNPILDTETHTHS